MNDSLTTTPKFRLSAMMFLQYAVWGAWIPIISRYLNAAPALDEAGRQIGGLGFSWAAIGTILGIAGAVGAVVGPFVAGQVADRWFSAERFLCVMFILGGIVKYITASATTVNQWLWLSILYSVLYMPTIAISNSLAFSHLKDPDRQFPPIRLWGTIGWIVVSWVFPMVWLQSNLHFQLMPPFLVGTEHGDVVMRIADSLRFAGILSVCYGVYCLFLPHTPPKKSVESIAVADSFRLLRHRGLLVLTIVSLPISIVYTVYIIQTAQFLPTLEGIRDSDILPVMSIGQFSEIFVLGSLGLFLKRLGFRTVLTIGCLGFALRFAAFGLGTPTWLVVASQALHGVCFACFYAAAFIYVDRVAPAHIRHSAQTVFGIILLGIGPALAGHVIGWESQYATQEATIAECVLVTHLVPQSGVERNGVKPPPLAKIYEGAKADMDQFAAANPQDVARAWRGLSGQAIVTVLNYRRFWMLNAAIALASMLFLAIFFRLDPPSQDARVTQ